MTLWENRKTGALEREKASSRLDCFLSVLYLYPNCLDVKDVELLAKREKELTTIYRYAGQGFFCLYYAGVALSFWRRGARPFFKDVIMHTVLGVTGTFGSAFICEKVAAELYYNRVLI